MARPFCPVCLSKVGFVLAAAVLTHVMPAPAQADSLTDMLGKGQRLMQEAQRSQRGRPAQLPPGHRPSRR